MKILETTAKRLERNQNNLDSHKAKKADQCQTKSCQPTRGEKDSKAKAIVAKRKAQKDFNTIGNYM